MPTVYFGGTVPPFQIYQQQCPAENPKKREKSSFFIISVHINYMYYVRLNL